MSDIVVHESKGGILTIGPRQRERERERELNSVQDEINFSREKKKSALYFREGRESFSSGLLHSRLSPPQADFYYCVYCATLFGKRSANKMDKV